MMGHSTDDLNELILHLTEETAGYRELHAEPTCRDMTTKLIHGELPS